MLFLIAFSRQINAQVCTGGLGDPVVNITFGTAGAPDLNFPPPSAYTYTTDKCPNDGFYTITTQTSGCFGNSWYTVNNDHTGGGAFMLVNASYNPGDFFKTTVSALCPNTTYEFAAWVMNVLNYSSGIKPDLTFTIETPGGVVLNSYSTGPISITGSPNWQKVGFFFTTDPANPTIILRITNNAPGGNGNDLALDDITFRPCGPATTSSVRGGSDNNDVCEDAQPDYIFDGTVSTGYSNPIYQWQVSNDNGASWTDIPGASSLQYTRRPTAAGDYLYRLSVAEAGNFSLPNCRVASNQLRVNVHALPRVIAGPERILIMGNSIVLQASTTGESPVYNWLPPDGLNNPALLNPIAAPLVTTTYKLEVVTAFGCQGESFTRVKVVNGIYVPTAFSPNNDGKNDHWRIPYLDPALNATVAVYNRYGQLVYQVRGAAVDWDGTLQQVPQDSGTSIYFIRFADGKLMKGHLTLIR